MNGMLRLHEDKTAQKKDVQHIVVPSHLILRMILFVLHVRQL